MRVHRLEMTAFGPFAETEVVDFDALNSAGVFLLTGQTGAGKTSILDAICFGLFGQVPGVRDKAKSYRSQHAAEGLAPRIVLDVTLQGRRLRIVRQPPWERQSRRARSGSVEEKARASVEELRDGRWTARSSRADEVGHLVTGLLGLNRDQFCQVVMLAQGEFQGFLRAGGRDRQRVLESLFGTQRFQAVERWLVEHRRVQSRRYHDHVEKLERLAARLHEVCSPVHVQETFALPETVADSAELLKAVRQLVASGQQAVERAAESLDDAMTSSKHAQHAYDEARARADLRHRHGERLRRHDELTAATDLVADREQQVRRARAAAALLPLVQLAVDADADASHADAAVADALGGCSAVPGFGELVPGSPPSRKQVARFLQGLQARASRLAELLEVEQDCDGQSRLVEDETRRRDVLLARLGVIDAELSAQPARVALLREQLGAAAGVVRRGADGESRLARAGAILAGAHDVLTVNVARSELQGRRDEAHEGAMAVTAEWLAAKEGLLAGVAAELAGRLEDGQGCPVCGSQTHPAPAAPADTHVSSEHEGALYARVTAAREAVSDIDRSIQDSWTVRSEALVRSAGLTPEQAQNLVDETIADTVAAAGAARTEERLAADLQRLLDRAGEQQAALESATTEGARVDERLNGLELRLQAGLARLTAEVGAGTRVAAALELTERCLALARTLDGAVREHDHAERAATRSQSRLATALDESEFEDASDVLAAALPQSATATLEALNRAHAGELEACLHDLRDPVLLAAAAGLAPDLETLEAAAAAANAEAGEATSVASAVLRRQERLEELVDELAVGAAQLQPLRQTKDLADGVAGICSGSSPDNATRTALSNYVLAARLAQVVAAANARLDGICGGRYQLEHTMLRGAGDNRGGLGLAVHDAHTDRARDPATLSGGETFYVSLSLALGLADVVTAEAGGAELATLFVDEGFGGLDDDTREEVLDELDALRSGGRTIGLVSHLSELRARIPTQLHVVAGAHGSTCRPVSGTGAG